MKARDLTAISLWSLFLIAICAGTSAGVPTDSDPPADPVEALIASGGKALAEQSWDEALAFFERARQIKPDDPLPHLGLSQVHQQKGDLLKALESARQAQSLEPRHAEAVRRVARLQIRIGAPLEGLATLKRLRELRPDDMDGYVLAALVMRQIERIEPAVELLRQALSRGLDTAAIHEQLAFLELTRGRASDARSAAEQGLKAHPDHAPLAMALGMALAADPASRAEAIAPFNRALQLGVREPGRIHLELGTLLGELAADGCSRQGLEHLLTARDQMPESADAHFRLGNLQRACGDLELAKHNLQRFQALNREAEAADHGGRSVGASLNRAQELAAEGRLTAALELIEKLAESKPKDDRIWTLKAKILFSMDRKEPALKAAQEATRLMPGRVETHYLEGLFLSQMGRLTEARQALERAAAVDAKRGEVQALWAAVLAEQGELADAAHHYEIALALDAGNPGLRLAYAKLLKAIGQTAESERQMEVYRALGGS